MSDDDKTTGAMLKLTRFAPASSAVAGTLSLGFEDRRRSRQLARLDDGREAAVHLPRGTVLRDGDRLIGEHDASPVVVVRAAPETLSVAHTTDAHLLARAAYHLGNRHVPLQVAPDNVAYQHDHVLDGMVRELGLTVATEWAPFEPEAGGYRHEGSERHGHEHKDEHGHKHEHEHGHHHHHDGDD